MNHGKDVIIVGAGAAGLMAASGLLPLGYRVTVLEARARTGGRFHTLRNGSFSQPIELGVEFIHGNLPLTMELLDKAGITYIPVGGNMNRVKNGDWEKQDDFAVGWEEIMKKMNDVRLDVTLQQFLDEHFSDAKYELTRESVLRFAEGFDLADPSKASVLSLREEWMGEEGEQYRIPGGYDQLTDFLYNECMRSGAEILTSSPVTEITWSDHKISVSAGDKTYMAEKLIITVPLSILSGNSIKFSPDIPAVRAAASGIGFGNVVKCVLEFSRPFWEEKKRNAGFIFSNETIPTWWTQAPSHCAILTSWAGGPQSKPLETKSEDELLQIALLSLSHIFNIPSNDLSQLLRACRIMNWKNENYTRGAYSFGLVGSNQCLNVLNRPINDTIYFAGEGCYSGPSPGTVEAALVSAKNTVEKFDNLSMTQI